MPSIQDVADQINAKLDLINQNTTNTAQNTANTVAVAQDIKNEMVQANNRLNAIDNDLLTGFANLSQGLFAISELQKVSIALLDANRQQNDTIICLIENSNELLCGITRKLTRQLDLSAATLTSVNRIEGIAERSHAGEAADYDRHTALQAEIEACCPPDEERPEPCPEACEKPSFRPPSPKGRDWKPLPTPKDSGRDPVG
jgi:hypothetical protein